MIYRVSGEVLVVGDDTIVIDTASGLAYAVFVPVSLLESGPRLGETLCLYTYHVVKEDAQLLYGFLSTQDRRLFSLLISVSGTGPKVAMKILSTLSKDETVQAIVGGQIHVLTRVSGVGKKMAERLIIELKDRMQQVFSAALVGDSRGGLSESLQQDVTLTLRALGYQAREIKAAMTQSSDQLADVATVEACVKVLLKQL